MSIGILTVLFLVLASEFVNGWTDAPNAIVTVVSTKVLSLRQAVVMAVILNIVGVLIGTAVAVTIGKEIVNLSVINLQTISAALISLVLWSTLAAFRGIPTSESHALIAGLTGAALATAGPEAVLWLGWKKVFIGLFLSSALGFTASLILAKIIFKISANASPTKARKAFDRMQIASAAFMAFNHGLNDGQKFIGVFVMTLVIGGIMPQFAVPLWVIMLCATVMGIGTSFGGRKIIQKTGMEMVDIESWQGFCSEMAAGLVISIASFFGIPLSTSHAINTSIMGASAAKRVSSVRWSIVGEMVLAWVITFPFCGALSYGVTKVLMLF